MTLTFTDEEKKFHKCTIFDQGIDRASYDDRELPTDIHIVEYTIGGDLYFDSVRAYKTVDIFDVYYDKLKTVNGELITITNGFGRIKPKLFTGKGSAQ